MTTLVFGFGGSVARDPVVIDTRACLLDCASSVASATQDGTRLDQETSIVRLSGALYMDGLFCFHLGDTPCFSTCSTLSLFCELGIQRQAGGG